VRTDEINFLEPDTNGFLRSYQDEVNKCAWLIIKKGKISNTDRLDSTHQDTVYQRFRCQNIKVQEGEQCYNYNIMGPGTTKIII